MSIIAVLKPQSLSSCVASRAMLMACVAAYMPMMPVTSLPSVTRSSASVGRLCPSVLDSFSIISMSWAMNLSTASLISGGGLPGVRASVALSMTPGRRLVTVGSRVSVRVLAAPMNPVTRSPAASPNAVKMLVPMSLSGLSARPMASPRLFHTSTIV
ncbi:hypothetical protein ES703_26735 [subsurface metagenome]